MRHPNITKHLSSPYSKDDRQLHNAHCAIVVEECHQQQGNEELGDLLKTIRQNAKTKDSLSSGKTGGTYSTITDFMTDAFTADERAATTINGLVRTASMRTPAAIANELDAFTELPPMPSAHHHERIG